jgi:SAM-dependent methyltransferase
MFRTSVVGLAILTLLALFTAGGVGLSRQQQATCDLTLLLPGSEEPPGYAPERVPKLTINGKDEPVKWGQAKTLTVKVPVEEGKETIKIVYSYWPYMYSNTIRTKEAKLEKGKAVRVDFNVMDVKHPDLIKPIYYPTPAPVGEEMCKMANVGKNDVVYDIGCGDGRLVIIAVKQFGAKKGVGIDIDPALVKLCNENAKKAGVSDKVQFRNEDALKIKDLSDATVVLLYVGEDFGKALEPVLRMTLKPGARIVSHRFPLGDWEPDTRKEITARADEGHDEQYELLLWKVK